MLVVLRWGWGAAQREAGPMRGGQRREGAKYCSFKGREITLVGQGELRDGRSERHALGLRDRGLGPDSCTVWQNAVQGRHSPHASDRVALKTSQAGRAWAGSGTVRRGRPSGPAQAAGRSPGAGALEWVATAFYLWEHYSQHINHLSCMCTQLHPTPCDPRDCSPPGSCLWDFPGKDTREQ